MKEITPHTSIIVCADEETMASVLDRLQPYQKAIVTAPKYSANSGARKATNESPWRHIGELGEIAYMEDGSRRWTLKGDWETMKIFLVYMANGDVQTHFAYIDGDDGYLRDCNGDDVGWLWCDAEYFMEVPQRPSLHNVEWWHRRRQAPIQLGTLSPVATHGLLAFGFDDDFAISVLILV